jgi:hypothetical protein
MSGTIKNNQALTNNESYFSIQNKIEIAKQKFNHYYDHHSEYFQKIEELNQIRELIPLTQILQGRLLAHIACSISLILDLTRDEKSKINWRPYAGFEIRSTEEKFILELCL